ncbi:MAG: putative extracellular nuclease [Saprospiraceae bacterium]
MFTWRIIKRNATRDLLQIHLKTASDNLLVLVLNHWPSRSGGTFESEPYRIMVAENLAYWTERIYEERGKDTSIILMGDFNDNPYDRSIDNYLMGVRNKQEVLNARNHKYHNLMYNFLGQGIGTYVYGSEQGVIDQFLVSKAIASNSPIYPFKVDSVDILAYPEMVKGDYKKPIRFGRPSSASSFDLDGFSDHLPIELILKEKT